MNPQKYYTLVRFPNEQQYIWDKDNTYLMLTIYHDREHISPDSVSENDIKIEFDT
jgi:hypothetical protein